MKEEEKTYNCCCTCVHKDKNHKGCTTQCNAAMVCNRNDTSKCGMARYNCCGYLDINGEEWKRLIEVQYLKAIPYDAKLREEYIKQHLEYANLESYINKWNKEHY